MINPYHSSSCQYSRSSNTAVIKNIVSNNSNGLSTPDELINSLQRQTGSRVKYITAYKAVKSCMLKLKMILDNSYQCINGLIQTFNNESVFYDIQTENNCSKHFFMTWKATKHFYSYGRKIITVDGAFIFDPNKRTLLVAAAQDGFDNLILLAFAIVESEDGSSWKYFINNLDLRFYINKNQTIIAPDKDLGLQSSILEITPDIIRCNCVRHIAKNLKLRFGRNLITKYWKLVYEKNKGIFNSKFEELRNVNNELCSELDLIGVETWAN